MHNNPDKLEKFSIFSSVGVRRVAPPKLSGAALLLSASVSNLVNGQALFVDGEMVVAV